VENSNEYPCPEDEITSFVKEQVSLAIHKPDDDLTVRCANCTQTMIRKYQIIQSMNRVDGFPACSDRCRKEYIAKTGTIPHLRTLRTHAA
jgi:hypothetical protein